MIEQATTSGIGVEVVVGRPGSGKTYALGVAADAWRAAGHRVVGCSLQGGASEVLAVEATLSEQYTLTGLLVRCDRQPAFLAGSVVICDEAGMLTPASWRSWQPMRLLPTQSSSWSAIPTRSPRSTPAAPSPTSSMPPNGAAG
jgi:hypothetical protein